MGSPPTKTDSLATILAAALATGLAGGALTTAAALGTGPRALASFGRLLGPAAIACCVLALAALVLFAVLVPLLSALTRGIRPRGTWIAGLGTALALAAATWPLAVGDEVTRAHLVTWALTSALGGGVVLGFGDRVGERMRSLWLLGLPIASVFVLAGQWARTYSSSGLGLGLWALAPVALVIAWRGMGRVPALPVLFALSGAIAASGIGGLLRGDGDLRNHRARPFDENRPRPVILITVDTLRPDFLSQARRDGAVTPTMDALFEDSVVFRSARSSAPWTKPAVATIVTGLSPLVHGTTNRRVRLPEEAHTLAEHMRDAGYTTAGMGLNVHLEPYFGFAQGFDQYWFPVRREWGDSLGSKVLGALDPARYPALFPTTEALADVAVRWLEDNRDRDFFLWIHFLDPHWPYEPPAEYVPPREPGQRIGARWGDHETVTEVQAGTYKLGEEDQARVRALYRGEIEYVDAELARVIAKLRELGLYDQALIVFTSDHGEEFWEHGRFEHGHTLYDEVLRVPLAFKLPGNEQHAPVDTAVGTEALTPTLLELCNIEAQHPLSAGSLVRFWNASGNTESEDALAAGTYYYNEKRMLLSGDLKLIVDHATGRVEVYDLGQDPGERAPLGLGDERVGVLLGKLERREEELSRLREQLDLRSQEVGGDANTDSRLDALGYGQSGTGGED